MKDASLDLNKQIVGTLTESLYDSISDNFFESAQFNVQAGKKFSGMVVDNNDPEKLGRCKVHVFGIFDDIPVNMLPWASPEEKFLGSTMGSFVVPPNGALVKVEFDNNQIYNPIYTCKAVNAGTSRFVSDPGEDYPDTMVLFETDRGDFFKINRRSGRTVYRHTSGALIIGDESGNLIINTTASSSGIVIESGGALDIHTTASCNVISDDHVFIKGKVVCIESASMLHVKSDLVVSGNIKATGLLDAKHVHIGNAGYPTSNPVAPVVPVPYAGGGSVSSSSSTWGNSPVNLGNPQLESIEPPTNPNEDLIENQSEPTMEEITAWKEEFKTRTQNWLLAKHNWELATLSHEQLSKLPTYYIAIKAGYGEHAQKYEEFYLKEMEALKVLGVKLRTAINNTEKGIFTKLKDSLGTIKEKIAIELPPAKIEHFSFNIPHKVVKKKIKDFKFGDTSSLKGHLTIGRTHELFAKEIISQTEPKTGMGLIFSSPEYKPLKFKDSLDQTWEYKEETNTLSLV